MRREEARLSSVGTEEPALETPPPSARPAEVLRLEDVACRAETRSLYPPDGDVQALCDRELETCFLEIDAIQPREMGVSLGVGAPPAGFAEVRYGGLILRGFFATSRVVLFPRAELRMGGFFRPRRLRVLSATAAGVVVAGDPGPAVRSIAPVQAEVRCDELSWGEDHWVDMDEVARLVGAHGPGEMVDLAGESVELSVAPDGPGAATLVRSEEMSLIAYQAERGARFVIAWTDGGDAFGWVRADRVLPVPPGGSAWGASGGGRGFAPVRSEWYGLRCPHDIPILVTMGERLLEAGVVPRGAVFSVGAQIARGLHELVLRHQRFSDYADPPELRTPERVRLVGDAKLAVERRALSHCERHVPGEPPERR
jgi:hypothetical protein